MTTHSSIFAWKNSMDRGAWQATVHGVAKSWTEAASLVSPALADSLPLSPPGKVDSIIPKTET